MAVRDRYVGDPPPASTLMIVAGFTRPEFLVEVEAVAAVAAAPATTSNDMERTCASGSRTRSPCSPTAPRAASSSRTAGSSNWSPRQEGRRRRSTRIFDASRHVVVPGLDQHPPPLLPDADPRPPGGDQQGAVSLAEGALSDLGAEREAGRLPPGDAAGADRTADVGLHLRLRPPLPLSRPVSKTRWTSRPRRRRALGMRMTLTRGSMNLSEKDGGLPPDTVVQDEDTILADCERVLGRYHDPTDGAMLQVALAPCAPFTVTKRLMVDSVGLAERYDCRLHTHLGETRDENEYCLEHFGCRPVDYLEECGWLTDRVWLAHGIHFNDDEVPRLGRHRVGVCHCPTSNMVLASGQCRTKELEAAGSPVGLGVDGSASNDNSNLMEGVRHALMINRLTYDAASVTHFDALRWATEGSARCLGRDDIGAIARRQAGRPRLLHARRTALLRRRRSARRAGAVRRPRRRPRDGQGRMAGRGRRSRSASTWRSSAPSTARRRRRSWRRCDRTLHAKSATPLLARDDHPRLRRQRHVGLDRGPAGRGDRAARAAPAGLYRHLHRRGHDRAASIELLPDDLPVTFLPVQAVGKSNEHISSPGTLTTTWETTTKLWLDIGDSVHRAGVEKLIVINSHGGNVPMVDIVARELRVRHDMLVVGTAWSRFGHPEGICRPARRRSTASTAARSRPRSCSTSAPTWCGWTRPTISARAQLDFIDEFKHLRAHGPVQFGWKAQDLNPDGTVGNAAAATAEKGKAVVDHQAAAFVALCRDVDAFDTGAAVDAVTAGRLAALRADLAGIATRRRRRDAQAQEPRFLLVLADPEAAARRQARRPRRPADEQGRGGPHRRGLRPPSRAADGARRRHRQLRPGGAARRRRRARPHRPRPGRHGRAGRRALRGGRAPPRHRPGAPRPGSAGRWELRFHPSTRKQATIGGFIAGGAAGCGSCTWGQISDPGAVIALEVVTVEETPRVIELEGPRRPARCCTPMASTASSPRSRCRWRRGSPGRSGWSPFRPLPPPPRFGIALGRGGRHRQEGDRRSSTAASRRS